MDDERLSDLISHTLEKSTSLTQRVKRGSATRRRATEIVCQELREKYHPVYMKRVEAELDELLTNEAIRPKKRRRACNTDHSVPNVSGPPPIELHTPERSRCRVDIGDVHTPDQAEKMRKCLYPRHPAEKIQLLRRTILLDLLELGRLMKNSRQTWSTWARDR